MYNNTLKKKRYYVDSISINTERGLRQKGCSYKCLSPAPVGNISDLFIKTFVGILLSSIIFYFLFIILNLPTQDSYIKPALAADNQAQQDLIEDKLIESIQSVASSEQANLSAEQAGRPIYLKIPTIDVDAAVEYVGLTSKGAMDVPKGPSGVAWFELGVRPGENGSAVMAGHYGRWKNGEGSVFDDLNKLRKGDKLYIEDEKGEIATFVVRESRRYDPNADAKDVFSSNDGGSHLNLIACDGVWNKVLKSYSERLVVFTDKE